MINDKKVRFLIAQGTPQKFRKFMELTSGELLYFAMGFISNKEIAEEIVSDVFVKIWNNKSEIEKIQNLKSYLFICVKNGCISHIRKKRSERIIFLDEYKDFQFLPVDGPENDYIDSEVLKEIHEAIDSLPPKCRMAFTLAKINGLKHKEIAEVMEVSEKTVNNHLVSAVKKITSKLGITKKSLKKRSPLRRASLFSF